MFFDFCHGPLILLFRASLNSLGLNFALPVQVAKSIGNYLSVAVLMRRELGLSRLKWSGWCRLCCRLHGHVCVEGQSFTDKGGISLIAIEVGVIAPARTPG